MSTILQDSIQQMNNIQFEKEASAVVDVSEEEIKQGILDCTNSCYGKFITKKEINLKGLRNAILKAWKCHGVKVFRVLPNTYHFFFKTPEELQEVTKSGPWNIDNNLLVIRNWYPGIKVEEEDFLSYIFLAKHHGPTMRILYKGSSFESSKELPGYF